VCRTSNADRSAAIHSLKAITVVVADDHPLHRHRLVDLLRRDGIEVLADVPNGAAAIEAALRHRPDVVVMDLNMPGVSGLEATRRLVAADPGVRVLVLTVSAQEEDVAEALTAGAAGYVLKDAPVEEIVAAVRAAAAGTSTDSRRLPALVAEPGLPSPRRRWFHFSRSSQRPS
jgi:DNA-binding NarL/FixJ family response regulator